MPPSRGFVHVESIATAGRERTGWVRMDWRPAEWSLLLSVQSNRCPRSPRVTSTAHFLAPRQRLRSSSVAPCAKPSNYARLTGTNHAN